MLESADVYVVRHGSGVWDSIYTVNKLTLLEQEILTAILGSLVGDTGKVSNIVDALGIAERSFSPDVVDKNRCSGFYLTFSANNLLSGIQNIPHHLSVQASHKAVPAGGDFILFFRQDEARIDFLEATFFDYTLPIDELMSAHHGFTIRRDE